MKKLIFLLVVCVILSGCTKESYLETKDEYVDSSSTEESIDEGDSESIYVQIQGAVKNPGVYEAEDGSRVFQVIEMAGGLLENADDSDLNQALLATDGQMIYVYTKGEREALESNEASDGKVDINTSSKEELMTLPGIGESKADSIVEYRQSNGMFSQIEDIKQITGIKDGVYNKIKDLITVGH